MTIVATKTMDVTGLVFGILGQVQLTIDWVKLLREHRRNKKENRALCGDLLARFNKAEQTLDILRNSETAKHMSSVWKLYFEKMESCFKDSNKELERLAKGLKPSTEGSTFGKFRLGMHTFVKANKWMEVLKSLKEGLEELERDSMHLDGFATILSELRTQHGTTSSEFGSILDALKAQGTILRSKLNEVIATQAELSIQTSQPTTRDGEFRPTFHVPKNPSGVKINLDDPCTLEGALRSKILGESSTLVGAVGGGSASDSEFAVRGLGGVGKTCALKAIGGDPKVQELYSGGVYFFSLGRDVESVDVIDMIAEVIEGTGGALTAGKVRRKGKVSFAMQAGGNWFNSKRCLFLCDDLWRTAEKPQSYLHDFEALVLSGSNSSVLFSTRDHRIGEGLSADQAVIFAERCDDEASSMLCSYASVSSVDNEALHSFNFVLNTCGGLPVALAVAGRAVKGIARSSGQVKAWAIYKRRLQSSSTGLINVIKSNVDGYSGLFTALCASLEGTGYLAEIGGICTAERMKESYQGLCVLRKQAWIPQSALSYLWGTMEETVEAMVELMGELSLLNIEYREINGRAVLGVTLHDLAHEYCLLQSKKWKEVSQWHSRLLDRYKARCSSLESGQHADDDATRWWLLEDDHYLHSNLAHHFAESKRWREFQELILNFRWTCRQLHLSGLPVIADEFQRLSEHLARLPSSPTSEAGTVTMPPRVHRRQEERGKEIGLIIGSVRLSWPRVTQERSEYSERELAFQIHGRLSELGLRFPLIKRYLSSVDDAVEKPWARPMELCLEAPSGPRGVKFFMNGAVLAVSLIPGTNHVIAGDYKGHLCIFDIESAEVVKTLGGHKRAVSSVAVSQDGLRIVSGSYDKTVRIWSTETGKPVGEPLRGHEEFVTSVAMSGDGQRIVSGSDDKTVRVWNMETSLALGEPLRGHEEWVLSVAVSRDGCHIVSGSRDKTVRIWDLETRMALGEPLRGHEGWVTSVAVSGDGRQVLSGSVDKTVRIWDMGTRVAVGEPLRGHHDLVRSIAISRDGRRIVSGSYDKTVRIWDVEAGVSVGEPLRGPEDIVSSVSLSADGLRIVAGSDDNTVRIWDVDTGFSAREPLRGHKNRITSIARGGSGQRIVSGSWDKTVRTWDMKTRMTAAEPLRGHEDWVLSVAVSEDDRRIVSGSEDKTIRIWDVETRMAIGEPLRGHESLVTSVAISGDSQRIVSGSWDKTVRIWDVETGLAIGEPLRGHEAKVTSVVVCGDDRRIVSGSSDKTVRIWDMETRMAVTKPLRGHEYGVVSVSISDDGHRIVSEDCGGNARAWDVETGEAVGVQEPLGSNDRDFGPAWREGLFCVRRRDAVYYGYLEGVKKKMLKMGSFDTFVEEWVVDAEKKLWAVLNNNTLVIVSSVE